MSRKSRRMERDPNHDFRKRGRSKPSATGPHYYFDKFGRPLEVQSFTEQADWIVHNGWHFEKEGIRYTAYEWFDDKAARRVGFNFRSSGGALYRVVIHWDQIMRSNVGSHPEAKLTELILDHLFPYRETADRIRKQVEEQLGFKAGSDVIAIIEAISKEFARAAQQAADSMSKFSEAMQKAMDAARAAQVNAEAHRVAHAFTFSDVRTEPVQVRYATDAEEGLRIVYYETSDDTLFFRRKAHSMAVDSREEAWLMVEYLIGEDLEPMTIMDGDEVLAGKPVSGRLGDEWVKPELSDLEMPEEFGTEVIPVNIEVEKPKRNKSGAYVTVDTAITVHNVDEFDVMFGPGQMVTPEDALGLLGARVKGGKIVYDE